MIYFTKGVTVRSPLLQTNKYLVFHEMMFYKLNITLFFLAKPFKKADECIETNANAVRSRCILQFSWREGIGKLC